MIEKHIMSEADQRSHSGDDEWIVRRASDGGVATALVLALAEAEGVDPCNLDFTLGELLDPDALNRLFERTTDETDAVLSLQIAGYEARVRPGVVKVRR
jgi:hypothetical protein